MAVVKFRKRGLLEKNLYCNEDALRKTIHYIMSAEKTPNRIIGALGANPDSEDLVIKQFQKVKDFHRNAKGKKVLHFVVSLKKDENLPLNKYLNLGYDIAEFFCNNYQVVFALHENSEFDHIHFVVNTVNYKTGKKIRWNKKDFKLLIEWIDKLIKTEIYNKNRELTRI